MGDVGALALGAALWHDRGHRAPGDRALHHGRPVRRRDPVGDGAGAVFKYTGGAAHLPHGAAGITISEQSGWKETQVVVRFWIITIMLVLFGLSTLKLR